MESTLAIFISFEIRQIFVIYKRLYQQSLQPTSTFKFVNADSMTFLFQDKTWKTIRLQSSKGEIKRVLSRLPLMIMNISLKPNILKT